jgi:hypothetical protein
MLSVVFVAYFDKNRLINNVKYKLYFITKNEEQKKIKQKNKLEQTVVKIDQ